MKNLSQEKFEEEILKAELKNESIERYMMLKETKRKYNPFKMFMDKVSTSNKVLIAAIVAVIAYVVTCLVLAYKGIEVGDTLTVSYFGFWGVELINLASIKNTKTKASVDDSDALCDELEDETDDDVSDDEVE